MKLLKSTFAVMSCSVLAVLLVATPSFALFSDCMGEGKEYDSLEVVPAGEPGPKGYIRCATVRDENENVDIYGFSTSDCTQVPTIVANPQVCRVKDKPIDTFPGGTLFERLLMRFTVFLFPGVRDFINNAQRLY